MQSLRSHVGERQIRATRIAEYDKRGRGCCRVFGGHAVALRAPPSLSQAGPPNCADGIADTGTLETAESPSSRLSKPMAILTLLDTKWN